jgi:hypothetical protein
LRSSGLNHEVLLGARNLPILKNAIINFHDPYPFFWYQGSQRVLSGVELFRLKTMFEVIQQAKSCISTSKLMANDLEFLYGSRKKFFTLPHQFDPNVFDLSDRQHMLFKTKKVTITHHGAIMFGRNVDIILDAYQDLVESNRVYYENTEFILRLKGQENNRLREKYASIKNILVFDEVNFSNSSNEQIHETDIAIILENGPICCNILVGKAPFLATYNKPVLVISPCKSELRNIIVDQNYIASMDNKEEIKFKLEQLILDRMKSNSPKYPFGDYFNDDNFKKMLDEILIA